jgi:hypothetical protein
MGIAAFSNTTEVVLRLAAISLVSRSIWLGMTYGVSELKFPMV